MHHFFAEPGALDGDRVTITGSDVSHIRSVLRMKAGEKVLVSVTGGAAGGKVPPSLPAGAADTDSRDGEAPTGDILGEIAEIREDAVEIRVLERLAGSRELPARIHLYQGMPKSDKMELIIQKAVELGAFRVIPVMTRNTVVKLDGKKEAAKTARFNAIALAAAKQSKRSIVPEVAPFLTFGEALREARSFDMKIFCYENAEGIGRTRTLIDGARPGMDIAVMIGPEGGFDETEARAAEEAGFASVTLGKRILRTETAGLCLLSALMLQLEE